MSNSRAKTDWMDRAAVFLSALCLLHCLALPLLVAGLPLLAQFSGSHLHAQMLIIVAPLSVLALGLGFRHHRNTKILWAGFIGLMGLILGATLGHGYGNELIDRGMTIAGSVVLAIAHYYNTTYPRSHAHCHHPEEPPSAP